jgi:hypothetical protein
MRAAMRHGGHLRVLSLAADKGSVVGRQRLSDPESSAQLNVNAFNPASRPDLEY